MEIFLSEVYLKVKKGDSFSLDELARSNKISGSAATVIKRAGVVTQVNGDRKNAVWAWAYAGYPGTPLATYVMDEIMEATRRRRAGGEEPAGDDSEAITPLPLPFTAPEIEAPQIALNRAAPNGMLARALASATDHRQLNIFDGHRERQADRVYVAGCIAGQMYHSLLNTEFIFDDQYGPLNAWIAEAADDLLNKLYSPTKKESA